MYEAPIKRAGLSFNRILYSNARSSQHIFPNSTAEQFKVHYKLKLFENGKQTLRQEYNQEEHLDVMFPSHKKSSSDWGPIS